MRKQNRKIGEILIEKGFITQDVLQEALKLNRQSGVSVTEYLIVNEHITELQLAEALSEQFKLPYLPISAYSIPNEVIKLVPVKITKKYWLIPIDLMKDVLTVAMANPLDFKAIEELERITGYVIQPFVALVSDINKAIRSYYRQAILRGEALDRKNNASSDRKAADRRLNKRVESSIVFHSGLCGFKKQYSMNISADGLLMEADKFHPVKKVFTILLAIPEGEPIDCKARIVWISPRTKDAPSYMVGVQFLNLSPEEKKRLKAAIETHKINIYPGHPI